MKKLRLILLLMLIGLITVNVAAADVNEEVSFTNFTDEDLYVELAVLDHFGWRHYDVYVLLDGTSIANFWTDTIFSTFSACAYGEFTDDFYGCIDGDLSVGSHHVYFDNSGVPYLSDSPNLATADLFLFDSASTATDVLVAGSVSHGHGGGGCFIGSLE